MKSFRLVLLCLAEFVLLAASQSANHTQSQPKRIDTHCHLVPPFYKDFLDTRHVTAGGINTPSWNVSAHLAINAQVGIVTSIVAISTPGAKLSEDAPIEEGRTLARQLNEYAYNLTVEYPKRFLFFATLTLPDIDGAVAEAKYALDNLKAAGVIVMASTFGELFGTPRYAPLYELLNERNTTVFIHPSNSPCPEASPAFSPNSTDVPPYVVDFLLDTTRAAINLVYRNVTVNYPNIKFILAHSGGFLPFAANRAAGALSILSNGGTSQAVYYERLKGFFVDTALSSTTTALPSTTKFFNNSQITYGSDYPYSSANVVVQNTLSLENFKSKKGTKKNIYYNNAYTLFQRFLV